LRALLLKDASAIDPGLICLEEVIVKPVAATEVPIVAITSAAAATTSAADGLRMPASEDRSARRRPARRPITLSSYRSQQRIAT
jgi:hypothetical protein